MIERPTLAIIGLNACTATAKDLHDVWGERLRVRGGAANGSAELPSFEQKLQALIVGAWADAFGEKTPRRVITYFTAFGTSPVSPAAVRRVINRIGGQTAESPTTDPPLEVVERAVCAAARQPDTAVIVVIADAQGRGVALILEAPEQAALRDQPPYALVEIGDRGSGLQMGDGDDPMAIVDAIMTVAFGTVPPQVSGRMWPWLAEKRVARLGGNGIIRQWDSTAATRHFGPSTRPLFRVNEPLFLAAHSREELLARIRCVREGQDPGLPSPGPVRLAVVAADPRSTFERLASAERVIAAGRAPRHGGNGIFFTETAPPEPRPLAFLYPGQGSQYAGMLADVCCYYSSMRAWFERLDRNDPAQQPSRWLFEPFRSEDERKESNRLIIDPEFGGQAGFVASMGLHELLLAMGLVPAALLGYSNGEIAALLLSGAIALRDRNHLFDLLLEVRQHAHTAEAGGRLPKGIAVAVTGSTLHRVEEAIACYSDQLFISMENCPSQVILFGQREAMESVISLLKTEGAVCLLLPFDRAYHTPLFARRAQHILEYYKTLDFRTPSKEIYSCATASPFPRDVDSVRQTAALQWRTRVRFRDTIERLYRDGIHDFIEVGASGRLSGYVHDILRGRKYQATPSNVEGRSGIIQLQSVAAQAFIAGWNVDTSIFRRVEPPPMRVRHARVVTASETAPRRRAPLRLSRLPVTAAPVIAAPSAPAADLVVAHFSLMEEFLESQKRAFAEAIGTCTETSGCEAPAFAAAWPFLGRIIRFGSGQLESIRTLSVLTDTVMNDHTLGRPASDDHVALPILPLSIAMEMMAEAAAMIAGSSFVVTGMRNVSAYRWVAGDYGAVHVRICATARRASAEAVEVEAALFEVPAEGAMHSGERAFEAIVDLRRSYETTEAAIPHRGEHSPDLLYGATAFYDHCMFHGPLLQMIRRVRAIDEAGIEAELEVPGTSELIPGTANPRLQLPALLLDFPGQLVAYWLVERGHEFFGEFPYHLGEVALYRPIVSHERLLCCARLRHDGATSTGAFEVGSDDGRVALRISDFSSRYYPFDRGYLGALYWPGAQTYVSTDLDFGKDAIVRFIGQITPTFLTSSHAIWSRGLAHMVLSDEERATFYSLPSHGLRRGEWLLGRVAAKEAVRAWAAANLRLELDAREIVVAANPYGKPLVLCDKIEGINLHLSIAHSSARAVAAVALTSVGVDYELEPRNVPTEAFSNEERRLWKDDALLPLWCAREAAAKASGRGLEGAWAKWRITEVSDNRRKVVIENEGTCYNVDLVTQLDQVFALCLM